VISAELRQRNLLPNLSGWHVLFTGLGATAGAQPPLPKPIRDKLIAYWTTICTAAGAASYDIDNSPVPATPPAATAAMSIVSIPGVASVTGPDRTGQPPTPSPTPPWDSAPTPPPCPRPR
jgi:hypothetical protein